MVREKKTLLKGQTSILSFSKGKNSKPALAEDEATSSSDDETRPVASSKNTNSEFSDLPPIHDIAAIFSDIVARTRTVTSLSRQVDDLEREAADLRRENGWLKEIVMLRTRRLTGGGPVNSSGSSGDQKDTGQPGTGKGKQRQ